MHKDYPLVEKKSVALASVAASFLLTLSKLVVGMLTGSLGLLSEAAHSGMDMGASLITYFAVRVADKPADLEHNYGHGKIENLSALVEAAILVVTCGIIIREAALRLVSGHKFIEVNLWAFGVIIMSIIVDFNRVRVLRRTAKRFKSQALEADALHFASDILSSTVVLAGLLLTRFRVPYADSLAALGVSILVIIAGLRLAKKAIDSLIDRAPDNIIPLIEDDILSMPDVKGIRNVRFRSVGAKYLGDLDLMVDAKEPLGQAHELASRVEQKVSDYHAEVVVHLEPCPGECCQCGARCNDCEHSN